MGRGETSTRRPKCLQRVRPADPSWKRGANVRQRGAAGGLGG
jgi:hypothetical protein